MKRDRLGYTCPKADLGFPWMLIPPSTGENYTGDHAPVAANNTATDLKNLLSGASFFLNHA